MCYHIKMKAIGFKAFSDDAISLAFHLLYYHDFIGGKQKFLPYRVLLMIWSIFSATDTPQLTY